MINDLTNVTEWCPNDSCAIQYMGSSTTLVAWSPTYDKWGNATSEDPNTHTSVYRCNTCDARWTISCYRQETTIEMHYAGDIGSGI